MIGGNYMFKKIKLVKTLVFFKSVAFKLKLIKKIRKNLIKENLINSLF